MRAWLRLMAGCLVAVAVVAVAGPAPTLAQEKAEKKAVAKQKASKQKASKQKASKRKSTRQKSAPKPSASKASDAKALSTAEASALPKSLTPQLSREEAQHKAHYDAAVAAVRGHDISSEDAGRIREAFTAIAAGNPSKAKALCAQVRDPAGAKLIEWYAYRNGYGTAAEIRAFLAANPTWPDRGTLTQRAEEVLFESGAGPAEVKAFFADTPPATAVGFAALAAALAADKTADKDVATAKVLAAKVWVELDIPSRWEDDVFKRIGGLITEADHKHRLDRLLMAGSRSASQRKARAATINRTIARLSAPERKKAQARLAVFKRSKGSHKLIAQLPPEALAKEWGLAFQRAQALRRQGKDEEAWKVLLAEPEPTLAVMPDGWWEERRANVYAALRAGKPKVAYELVRDPGKLEVNAHNDAAFMAGWLALRHLKDANKALAHFQALVKSADGPLSRARGHYWVGRTYEALGDRAKANESYLTASLQIDTFHGQLARLKLDPNATALKVDPPAAPTPEEIARFNGLDTVKAAVIADKAGLDHALVRAFLVQLRTHMRSEAEVAMLAHLAEEIGDTQMAVRIGKYGVAKGFNLIYYAYPVHRLPAYRPLRRPPETAVILGIARQESEFNTTTMSHVGARGILQVMPTTARHVCRDYKIRCDIGKLMKDPAYNTMLGSAYISDRMDEFRGSYILAIAGYNAGPGRAREWIREFGDPRDPKVDPIDWIHRIPFQETRRYVQKVLSNIQVYRARLGEEETAVRLNADLRRVVAAADAKGAVVAAD
ncbi:MAG: transglycosylase SLT domain-containing protein [Hyphomicrobiaceae bacterium]